MCIWSITECFHSSVPRYRSQSGFPFNKPHWGAELRRCHAKQPVLLPSSDFSSVMWKGHIISRWLECFCHRSDCNQAFATCFEELAQSQHAVRGMSGSGRTDGPGVCLLGEESSCSLFLPLWAIPSAVYSPRETPQTLRTGKDYECPQFLPTKLKQFNVWTLWKLSITSQSSQSRAALLSLHIFRRFIFQLMKWLAQREPASTPIREQSAKYRQWKQRWEHSANEGTTWLLSVGGLW